VGQNEIDQPAQHHQDKDKSKHSKDNIKYEKKRVMKDKKKKIDSSSE
jgi:hypothetical protein